MEKILSYQNVSLQIAVTYNQIEKEKIILENIIKGSQISALIVEAVKSGLPNPNLRLYKKIRKQKDVGNFSNYKKVYDYKWILY